MAFTRLNYERLWTNSADFPTLEESETKVREDFQYHPDAIRKFVNDLLTTLEGTGGAANIGTAGRQSVQNVLDAVQADVAELEKKVASGGGNGGTALTETLFSKADWSASGENYILRIPESRHGRACDLFGCEIASSVDGKRVRNSWDALYTDAAYDSVTGDVVLTAERAYDGTVIFFG